MQNEKMMQGFEKKTCFGTFLDLFETMSFQKKSTCFAKVV